MANITEKVVDGVVYTYDQEAKNPLGLRTKKLAWTGKLVYDVNKKAPNIPEDDGEEPSPGPSVSKPTFSPSAGNIDKNATVAISCSTSGAEIYYTTDGSEPSKGSTKYTSAITITADITIKAIAYATIEGEEYASSVATAAYVVVMPTVATPTFSPAAGNIEKGSEVTIACTTDGATIHYTTDGSAPTESSPVYSGAIAINSTTTIKAIAIKEDYKNSAVATASYTVVLPTVATPVITPASGSVSPGATAEITCSTAGATIYYTTDGSTPSAGSSVYSDPIAITNGMQLKAIAVKEDYNNSSVASANYTIAYPSYFGFCNGEDWGSDESRLPEILELSSAIQSNVEFTHNYTAALEQEDGCFFVYCHPVSIGIVNHIKDKVNNINYDNSFTKTIVQIGGVDYQLVRLTTATAPNTGTTFPITYSENVIS